MLYEVITTIIPGGLGDFFQQRFAKPHPLVFRIDGESDFCHVGVGLEEVFTDGDDFFKACLTYQGNECKLSYNFV